MRNRGKEPLKNVVLSRNLCISGSCDFWYYLGTKNHKFKAIPGWSILPDLSLHASLIGLVPTTASK